MVGEKIRQARQRAGFSQRHVSELAGLQQCQISDLEHDKLELDHVHWGTIKRLCAVLNLTPYDFMERDYGQR